MEDRVHSQSEREINLLREERAAWLARIEPLRRELDYVSGKVAEMDAKIRARGARAA